MMVFFISQCEKKALSKTRRILDSFANRMGDKVWQTVITQEGLMAVKKLLRKTASKNTAVACHWLRSRSRDELLWIIGNRQKFNEQGLVPVNSTKKQRLPQENEMTWYYLPLIESLTALSALLHDWGKASLYFNTKLKNPKKKSGSDPIRHEWVSMLLFKHCVGNATNDEAWLERLAAGELEQSSLADIDSLTELNSKSVGDKLLPPAAQLITWLIISHHKLPFSKKGKGEPAETLTDLLSLVDVSWGYENNEKEVKDLQACLQFPQGLLIQSKPWLKQIIKWATRMQNCLPRLNQAIENGSWRLITYYARLALMLGDYAYSSENADPAWQSEIELYANTDKKTGQLKQKLDEHLVGVAAKALHIVHSLPRLAEKVKHADDINLLKEKTEAAFVWQEKAVNAIKNWQKNFSASQQKESFGFFALNMASTGCGKTLANAKIMQALSKEGDSLRFTLCLGLRSLTLQTGDEYRIRTKLDNSQLAVLIGSAAVSELHRDKQENQNGANDIHFEGIGSESLEPLLGDDDVVDLEDTMDFKQFNVILKDERHKKMLYAPVLVCTIDHMMPVTECKRGGRYILPMLRLMLADLVIDEVDDFTGKDLIAVGRLIHMAGMLGRKVLLSSATIPPALAYGYWNAYREGWSIYATTHGASQQIGCAWIDEFNSQVETVTEKVSQYEAYHQRFIAKRCKQLALQPVKRKIEIIPCDSIKEQYPGPLTFNQETAIEQAYFHIMQQAIINKHRQYYTVDPISQKNVSFGVARVANIAPCVGLAEYLAKAHWPDGLDVRIMAYHSQQALILRSEQEKHLHEVLKRKEKPGEIPQAFKNEQIRTHLDKSKSKEMIFILVATPVIEIGQDLDLDWAVVEPSSLGTLIQLLGRILRHRNLLVTEPNVALMQYNLRALKNKVGTAAYCWPGYESSPDYLLNTHNLSELIDPALIQQGINAIPRIQPNAHLRPKDNWVDLEHYVMAKRLTDYEKKSPESLQGYLTQCWWLTALPQQFNCFRENPIDAKPIKLFVSINEDGYTLKQSASGQMNPVEDLYCIKKKSVCEMTRQKLWLPLDYTTLIQKYVSHKRSFEMAEERFGELSFLHREQNRYHHSFAWGLSRVKD